MTETFYHLFDTPEKIFYAAVELSVMLSVFAVLVAILIDFAELQGRAGVKKEKKSVVETGSMLLFFFGFYAILRTGAGRIPMEFSPLKVLLMVCGTLLVIAGCAVNVKGRLDLGRNWGNQIRIYGDHTFVTGGMYRLVRHPLYASLVWMFLGASLIYQNYLAMASALFVFIPFMRYRARQEEELLVKEFAAYADYRKKVGMFFPNLWNKN